jgi:hypothetical protein
VNNGKIEWTDEASMRVKKVPDFVRLGIYKLMEKRAEEKDYKVITSEFLSEIRDESMKSVSHKAELSSCKCKNPGQNGEVCLTQVSVHSL